MGGYGTMRIGMKQPGSFAALYAMSSCCLMNDPAGRAAGTGRGDAPVGPRRRRAGERAVRAGVGMGAKRKQASGLLRPADERRRDPAARGGEMDRQLTAVMLDQYVPALKSMRAIALDVGDRDPFVTTNRQLADMLTRVGIAPTLEVYEGDHGNRLRERFETRVLPFFSRQLAD